MHEAETALAAWGGGRIVRFLKDRENAVYEVMLPGGTRAALRLHRPGYQTPRAIRSELWWMQALARAGLPVPLPVETVAGDLLHDAGPRVATVIGWIDGTPLGEADVPLGGSPADKRARFRAIGGLLARMHDATDALDLPDWFERPRWDSDGLLGEAPLWGRFWDSPALTHDEQSLVLRARDAARDKLRQFAVDGDFGLIHADVLRENVLFSGETVSIIDFDDCGHGFRIYDFATLASQNQDEPDYDALMAAAVAGYRARRGLPDRDVALLPLFVLLRRCASMGWVVDRVPPGDPGVRVYARRAVRAAARWMAD